MCNSCTSVVTKQRKESELEKIMENEIKARDKGGLGPLYLHPQAVGELLIPNLTLLP